MVQDFSSFKVVPKDNSLLFKAIEEYDYEQLKELLELGKVDVNAKDKDGNTALHHLCLKGYSTEELKILLLHGADPSIENNEGWSPYEHFHEWDQPERNEPLALFAKAMHGINGVDKYGHTPLYYAMSLGNYRGEIWLARELVSEGADVRSLKDSDYKYETLENAAMLVTVKEVFLSLAEEVGGIDRVVREAGDSLLKEAVSYGNNPIAEVLLDHGVDPNVGLFEAVYKYGMER